MRYTHYTWDVLWIFRCSGFLTFRVLTFLKLRELANSGRGALSGRGAPDIFEKELSNLFNYTGGTRTTAVRQVGQDIIFLLPTSTQRAMQVEWKTVLHWHG